MYVYFGSEQRPAQGLDNHLGSSKVDAVSCHRLECLNTSNDSQKKKKNRHSPTPATKVTQATICQPKPLDNEQWLRISGQGKSRTVCGSRKESWRHTAHNQTPTGKSRRIVGKTQDRPGRERRIKEQTLPPPAMRDAATEPAEATPEPTRKTYAELAVQASATTSALRREGKGKAKMEKAPVLAPVHTKTAQASTTHAIVMHAAPLHYKPGTMRRWIEEDNKDMGVEIMGIRWLLKENQPGKVASSLVIYMKSARKAEKLRMGRRFFRTTSYDWDRISTRTRQRAMSSTRSTTSTEGPEPCKPHGRIGHCCECISCGGTKARKGEIRCGACGGEGWFIY